MSKFTMRKDGVKLMGAEAPASWKAMPESRPAASDTRGAICPTRALWGGS